MRALAAAHRALVADVHARFLGHGLAAGDPTQPAARAPDRGLWYRDLFEPNAWSASEIRAAFWDTLQTHGVLEACFLQGDGHVVAWPSGTLWVTSSTGTHRVGAAQPTGRPLVSRGGRRP